jgi:hypothetical protein
MSYSAPPPPPDPSYGYGYGYGTPRTSQKAVWSLVTGLIGLLCCSPAGIVALILGNSAKKEIAASGGAETGAGMAQAGVILGIIAIVLMVLGVLAVAAGLVTLPSTSTSP